VVPRARIPSFVYDFFVNKGWDFFVRNRTLKEVIEMDHNESCQDGVWVFLPFLPDGEWAHLTSEEARKQDGELKPENELIHLAYRKL